MKQTAVEWLEAIIYGNEMLAEAFKKAKEMEKQQIIDAFHKNSQKFLCKEEAEQYYNETFKNK